MNSIKEKIVRKNPNSGWNKSRISLYFYCQTLDITRTPSLENRKVDTKKYLFYIDDKSSNNKPSKMEERISKIYVVSDQ